MNFDLSEEQLVIAELATTIFGDLASPERVKEVSDGFDPALWSALAEAGLLGLCLPEEVGGSGMGLVELALIAEQQGRRVAPVPLGPAVIAARAVAEFLEEPELVAEFAAGAKLITAALAEAGANDAFSPTVEATEVGDGVRLVGEKPAVPGLPFADFVLVPARVGGAAGAVVVALVEVGSPGVEVEPLITTNHEAQGHLRLDTTVAAERVITDAVALDELVWSALVAIAAVQLGVAEGAVTLTAEHVATREQFKRPLAAFQAVSQRVADGYIATEALRSTVLNAAWQSDHGDDPRDAVLSAAYWGCEGTQQVVLGAQHLHAGLGADTDHPVHRHFLWGMQYASALGTAGSHLERLGRLIAAG